MLDKRTPLVAGTKLQLDGGSMYVISGDVIGVGGGGVLYPAYRLIEKDGMVQPDGFSYVIKECYPVCEGRTFERNVHGEIIPQNLERDDGDYLQLAQQMQVEEGVVSQRIYRTASRVLPIRELAGAVVLTLPGKDPVRVNNTITVMESLADKGRSLSHWLQERGRFSPAETLRIIQQVLFALREVHEAGYLHLDVQDGNIFLRGTLTPTDKSELVTLIDFGSARAMINGKTLPIQNRVIFTTPGFCAPEILLHNDGTLQLGAEADIFSVGCLMMMLLTGQRIHVNRIMADGSGRPLKPNQLRRIKCPKHLVGRMQEILAKALENDPENRYHSADEMLADVTDLVEALQPYRTDLRSVTYDAFVCYKHGPVDSQAAITLQRQLERFRAGKGVAKKRKPFSRVFVDEGELSSCADFGLQIREALKNSGWLIVVCSPETPMSPWVQSEIDTFLEYHDRSRVLAVLTDGDESISFPERLKASGEGGEILAADARGKGLKSVLKKLRGDALLKLAAPMLGTTFDTLKQRQKIYTLQKVAAATAAALILALAFAVYAVDRANVIRGQAAQIEAARDEAVKRAEQIASQAAQIEEQAVQIEQEYQNALINESMFLVQQAENRLSDNDPLGAMELLLQALPSEKQSRPIVPKADYLLGKALGIYRTPTAAENTVTVTGILPSDYAEMCLNESGSCLFTWSSHQICCWDVQSLTLLWEKTPEHSIISDLYLFSDSCIAYETYGGIAGIDAESGEDRWFINDENIVACFRADGDDVLTVLSGEQDSFYESGGQPDTETEFTIRMLDGITGDPVRENRFRIAGDQYLTRIWSSLDGKWAAICTDRFGVRSLDNNPDSLYVVDLETGTCELVCEPETSIVVVSFLADGSMAVMKDSGRTEEIKLSSLAPKIYVTPSHLVLERYAVSDGSLLWRQELFDHMTGGICAIREVPYHSGTQEGSGVMFVCNDRCILLDRDTGAMIRNYALPDAIVQFECENNRIVTVNGNGTFTIADYAADRTVNIPSFSKGVSDCCRNGATLFVRHNLHFSYDYTIRKYELNQSDSTYRQRALVEGNQWVFRFPVHAPDGDGVLLGFEDQICFVDYRTGESFEHRLAAEQDRFEPKLIGLSQDGSSVIWRQGGYMDDPHHWIDNSAYYATKLRSGEVRKLEQPPKPAEYIIVYEPVFIDGKLFFVAQLSEENMIVVYTWDLETGKLTELYRTEEKVDADWFGMETCEALSVRPEKQQLYFATSTYEDGGQRLNRLIHVDLDTGKGIEICPEFLPEIDPAVVYPWLDHHHMWTESGTYAVFGYLDTIYVTDMSGRLVSSIPLEVPTETVRFTENESALLVFSLEDGLLRKYRLEDGQLIDSLNLAEYLTKANINAASSLLWEYLDDRTMIFGDNLEAVLLDTSGGKLSVTARLDGFLDYDAQTNRFIIGGTAFSGSSAFSVGTCNRYTLEDLIRMASKVLQRG